jgi:formiminoglutamase
MKPDNKDLRWGDRSITSPLKSIHNKEKYVQLLGYADDEGITLNGGRPGASLAPLSIRKELYKTTLTESLKNSNWWIHDLGDLHSYPQNTSKDLRSRHEFARSLVAKNLKNGPLVTLGGGHDYGYSDSCGFMDFILEKTSKNLSINSIHSVKPLIINFDAHLDVRPITKGFNSGTPFFRFLNEFKGQADFLEIGIQDQCNSPDHREWCKAQGAKIISLNEIQAVGLLPLIKEKLLIRPKSQPCYISVDIDAFAQYLAPGCSQSWDIGLGAKETFSALNWIFSNQDVQLFSIYEVSPPLDIDKRTSKLAACLIHTYIQSLCV